MYMNSCGCNSSNAVNGLGASDTASALIPIAASIFGGPAAGAAAGAAVGAFAPSGADGVNSPGMMPAAPTSTVSPQISTQISPQISPNFQQQFQPQNSAMTAGTSQSLPAMPALNSGMPGAVPDYGSGMPGYAPQPFAPAVPSVPINWAQYMPYALAAMGIVAFVSIQKKKAK